MGLSFLNKKGFNPTNLKNVEKVWQAEQRDSDEQMRIVELRKKIAEERQIQDLREMQSKAGYVSARQEKLDWMYEGPGTGNSTSNEDYLLGREIQSSSDSNPLTHLATQPGSLWIDKISSQGDVFRRAHEDPMFTIKQREEDARREIISNPTKISRLRHQIEELKADRRKQTSDRSRSSVQVTSTHKRRRRSRNKSMLDESEICQKLAEYESNAVLHRVIQTSRFSTLDVVDDNDKKKKNVVNDNFIQTLNKQAYLGDDVTLESRLKTVKRLT